MMMLSLCGCPSTSDNLRDKDKAKSYNPNGKTTVVTLDISQSMKTSDRNNVSHEGIQLLDVLVQDGDNLGVVEFSSKAHVAVPVRTINNADDRRTFSYELTEPRRTGATNFVAALSVGTKVIRQAGAGANTSLLFLTDGEHSRGGDEADVLAKLQPYVNNGWKVHCIGYTEEAKSALLSQLASRTGGGLYITTTPKELFLAYLKISEDLQDLLFTDELKPVNVLPGTEELIYVILKLSPRTHATEITRDSSPQALTGPNVYHYPGIGQTANYFEGFRFTNPEGGLWDCQIDGPYEVVFILQKPPYKFEVIANAPGPEYYEGDTVPAGLRVYGKVGAIAEKASVDATYVGEDGSILGTVPLALEKKSAEELIYKGSMVPKLKDPKLAETQTVTLTFKLGAGDTPWSHDKKVTYRLLPRPDEAGDFGSENLTKTDDGRNLLDFGTVFRDQIPTTRAEVGVTMKEQASVSATPGLQVAPAGLPVGQGSVEVRLAPDIPNGDYTGEVAMTPSVGNSPKARASKLAVHARVVEFEAPSPIRLGTVPAGSTHQSTLPIRVDGAPATMSMDPLRHSDGLELPTQLDSDRTLRVAVPKTAHQGRYRSIVTVNIGDAKRSVDVELDVTLPEARIAVQDKLRIESTKQSGYTDAVEIPFQLDYTTPCRVEVETLTLEPKGGKGRSISAREVKIELEGPFDSDGKLAPGDTARAKVKVYISPDLRSGEFTGSLKFKVKTPDGREVVQDVPVEFGLTRQ